MPAAKKQSAEANLDHIAEGLRPLAVPVSDLIIDPANSRRHPEKNLDALVGSLRVYGQRKPVVVNQRTMIVEAGNGTVTAAIKLGWSQLAAVFVDDDPMTAAGFAISDNRTAELAEWDNDALDSLLREIQTGDEALQQMLAELADAAGLYQDEPAEVIEDEVPEPPVDPITKPGDLWILGRHRVLCGDSTKAEDVGRLMDGAKASMMFTDPPYGVDYSGGVQFDGKGGAVTNNRERLANDNTTAIYFDFLPVALSVVDGPCYMWFAGSKARDVYNAVHESKCEVHALIIWHKTNATYAAMNAQYKQRHEPCLYFKPKGSTLRWCGETTEATVWNQDRDGINEFHPTQKPVALAAKAIGNHDAANVLDMFCGSGSTLIAAEQLGRTCYGMEISTAYCDVILRRWMTLTNEEPTLEETGEPFGKVKSKRAVQPSASPA